MHLKFKAPGSMGSKGKSIFAISALIWILSWWTDARLEGREMLVVGGGMLIGLAMWSDRLTAYQGRTLEIVIDQQHFSLSKQLVKSAHAWPQFLRNGYIVIPWQAIERWDFHDPDNAAARSRQNCVEYLLYFKTAPGVVMTIDREALQEVEETFLPLAQKILAQHGTPIHSA